MKKKTTTPSNDSKRSENTHKERTKIDIKRNHLSIAILPKEWRNYAILMRLDRPIGTWLLFIPCLWGLIWGSERSLYTHVYDLFYLTLICAFGALLMRSAGCIWNDITDRDLDIKVARTATRPIANGDISVKSALVLMFFLMLICAGLVSLMGFYAFFMAAISIILVAIYPFCKRITWWPQLWLGMTFNWGILVAYSAVAQNWPSLHIWLLWGGSICWTIAYDTIYACQDLEDDALIGIKSTARLFASHVRLIVCMFFITTMIIWVFVAIWVALSPLFYLALIVPILHFLNQIKKLSPKDPALCLKLFKSNRNFGLWITFAFAIGFWPITG
ncbi:MAG: 4-hydroxybenzoate octaprenyltransferase [Pseudomonadota bacterium]